MLPAHCPLLPAHCPCSLLPVGAALPRGEEAAGRPVGECQGRPLRGAEVPHEELWAGAHVLPGGGPPHQEGALGAGRGRGRHGQSNLIVHQ